MAVEEESNSTLWSWDEDKAFEDALEMFSEDCSNRWEMVLAAVPGKTMQDIKEHYQLLVEDVNSIESGNVPLPVYVEDEADHPNEGDRDKKGETSVGTPTHGGGRTSKSDLERRKGVPWTEDEHKLFLEGLDKYGRGDWRSISRNFVVTRTPTQVASHAQKYFIRLNSINKERRRSSIHDITSVSKGDAPGPQGPITGLVNGVMVSAPGNFTKQTSPQPIGAPGVSFYGTTIGRPVGTPLVSAMGTPINLPVPATPHMTYGVGAPMGGAAVPGAPIHMVPVNYPMPQTSSASR